MKAKHPTLFHESDPRILWCLIKAGADVNARNEYGDTPLGRQVRVRAVRLLIAAGADVNLGDREGNTPLHLAFYPAAVFELLRAGANPNARNAKGELPESHWGDTADAEVMKSMLADVRQHRVLRRDDWRDYRHLALRRSKNT